MLFINYKISASREKVEESLKEGDAIIEAEKLSVSHGKPRMHTDINGESIKVFCEIVDGPTKDRDYKRTTVFRGKIKESSGITKISGFALTAPIYHAILFVLFVYFIYQCFTLGGFSIVPICLVVFDIFMFWKEFKKQVLIKRYIFGAMKLTYKKTNRT